MHAYIYTYVHTYIHKYVHIFWERGDERFSKRGKPKKGGLFEMGGINTLCELCIKDYKRFIRFIFKE